MNDFCSRHHKVRSHRSINFWRCPVPVRSSSTVFPTVAKTIILVKLRRVSMVGSVAITKKKTVSLMGLTHHTPVNLTARRMIASRPVTYRGGGGKPKLLDTVNSRW